MVQNQSVKLTSATMMYAYPSTQSTVKGTLSPQTVTSFESLNGWYHIKTWLGNLWVKP
jgi:g-D-glutamyl-meso-diaminopimelate peptidase